MISDYEITSGFLGRLGSVVVPAWLAAVEGSPSARRVEGVFDRNWVSGLPLPVDAPPRDGQKVALASATGTDAERMVRPDPEQLTAEYQQRPRTRVWESVDGAGADWTALTTVHLSSLLERRVICTLYQSTAGDDSLGPHDDNWWGVITQLRGAKHWRIWDRADDAPSSVVMTAGDVLLLPPASPTRSPRPGAQCTWSSP